MRACTYRPICFALLLLLTTLSPGIAQKTPVTPKDYGKWEILGSPTLSPNGKWAAYEIERIDGTHELRYRPLPEKGVVSGSIKSVTKIAVSGDDPAFSADSRWLVYRIGYSEAGREKLTKAKQPMPYKLGLVDLPANKTVVIENISDFAFSKVGAYLAMKSEKELLVRDLSTGVDTNFGSIAAYAWQDKGKLLAMTVDAEGKKGNGVQVYDPANETLRKLDSEMTTYTGLTWRKDSDDLAVLRARKDDKYTDETHLILTWAKVSNKNPVKRIYDQTTDKTFPKDTRIVSLRRLEWTEDGKYLTFGIKEWEPKKPEGVKAPTQAVVPPEDQPGVDVWHARDADIMPQQKLHLTAERNRSYLALWEPDTNKFIRLTSKRDEAGELTKNTQYALITDRTPYEKERMFGPEYVDLYAVEVETGKRNLIRSHVEYSFGASPAGRYVLFLENDHYWAYDLKKGQAVNLTKTIPTSFINTEDDHTVKQKPPQGMAGWSKGDRAILLYDKFDLWEVRPDGSGGTRLTNGVAEQIVHRYVSLDPEEKAIDTGRPMMLSLYGDRTKWYGFARMRVGQTPERLVWLKKRVRRLAKAKEAEAYLYSVEDFHESPNLLAVAADFKNPQTISDTNPFQKDYLWGHSELVDYTNKNGKKLQGALYYPVNYAPDKKWPMIVYIYEELSPGVHNYSIPSERSAYDPAVWTSHGYFVFMPDIVYRDRNPGLSAVECVVPAVEKVLQTGMVDRKKVGLVGHSWGAYQTAFIVTQTDLFAGAVAGAPLTDLISMYLSVYWNAGVTDARIFEISQGRMGVPFWEDVNAYMTNSPLFNLQKMKTPLLMTFGTQDGAVDWHQGIEFYNAARRAGKDLVMLVYEGENHGLAKKPNQIDYERRILAWFAHYLQGEPAERWMTEGVPYLERQKELERAKTTGKMGQN